MNSGKAIYMMYARIGSHNIKHPFKVTHALNHAYKIVSLALLLVYHHIIIIILIIQSYVIICYYMSFYVVVCYFISLYIIVYYSSYYMSSYVIISSFLRVRFGSRRYLKLFGQH